MTDWRTFREQCAGRGCRWCGPMEYWSSLALDRGTHQEQLTIEAANLRRDLDVALSIPCHGWALREIQEQRWQAIAASTQTETR